MMQKSNELKRSSKYCYWGFFYDSQAQKNGWQSQKKASSNQCHLSETRFLQKFTTENCLARHPQTQTFTMIYKDAWDPNAKNKKKLISIQQGIQRKYFNYFYVSNPFIT